MAMNQTVKLGDRDIARIGLGTNRLTPTDANIELIKEAIAAGLQMIDTAHLYTGGDSEKTIGDATSGNAADCVVATKGGHGGVGRGTPEVLRAEIAQSLSSLKTDVIDLYYLHKPDPQTPIEESLGEIKAHRDAGEIRLVGVSNVSIEEVERARKVVPVAAVQNRYNIAEREHDAVIDYCAKEGIVFVPFFPLRVEPSPAVRDVAKKHKATPQQIMLAWLLHRSPVTLPIPGTLSLDHLKQNLASREISLSDKEMRSLID